MKHILSVFLCVFALLPLSARSVDPVGDSLAIARVRAKMDVIRQYRPTVALVLSGGCANGAAHVGAMMFME